MSKVTMTPLIERNVRSILSAWAILRMARAMNSTRVSKIQAVLDTRVECLAWSPCQEAQDAAARVQSAPLPWEA